MTDDPLRELLTSPLDDAPVRRRSRSAGDAAPDRSGLWPWLPAAMVAGGVLVLAGYLVAAEPEVIATTTTTPSATTLAPTGPQFPPGYVAVGDRVGMRVERVLVLEDWVFVTLSQVVASTLAPGESAGIGAGRWELALGDGRTVTALEESLSFLTPGFLSVRFAVPGITAGDIVGLALTGLGFDAGTSVQTGIGAITLPEDGSETTVAFDQSWFDLEPGVSLEITDLTISGDQGSLEWMLSGSNPDALARTAFTLEVIAGEVSSIANTRSASTNDAFSLPSFRPSEREGRVLFDPPTPAGFDTSTSSLILRLHVTWTTYEPMRIAFDLPAG